MKSKILRTIFIIAISALGFNTLTATLPTYAQNDVCSSSAPSEVKEAAGCNGSSNALPGLITGILNAIIAVSGIVAVIFVLIGGINYMTSAGDSGKLEKAKKTILYAAIGLAIVALSFAIVNFVILNVINGNGQSSSDDNNTPTQYTSKSSCEKAGYNWDASVKECVK